jgi:hypothetical protein
MKNNDKNFKVGSTQTLSAVGEGKVLKKRCYQCGKTSVVSGTNKKGFEFEGCLNNCGPEALAKMLRF